MTDPKPTRNDNRILALGKWLTGSSALNFVLLGVIAVLALTITQQTHVIGALSGGVTTLRSQVETCKSKPANSVGCITPAAAAPELIVKQGSQGIPGLPGVAGAAGQQGPPGPAGPVGPPGVQGPVGKQGAPPGCALLATACTGAVGPAGAKGADGKDGLSGRDGKDGVDGTNGTDGQDGKPGADGAPGAQGEAGRGIALMICPPDDNDPATDQAWDISWTKEPLHTEDGVCRAKTAP